MKGEISILVSESEIELVADDLFNTDHNGKRFPNPHNSQQVGIQTIEDILVSQHIAKNVTSIKLIQDMGNKILCKVTFIKTVQ